MKTASRFKPGIETRVVLLLVASLFNVALGWACIMLMPYDFFGGYSTIRGEEAVGWVQSRVNLPDITKLVNINVETDIWLGMQRSIAEGILEDGTNVYVQDIVVGLPFLAFSGEWSLIGTQKNSTGLIIPNLTMGDAQVLVPYRPRVFGLIANTALFYFLLAILSRGISRLRKRRRVRRNRCPDCGYPKMDAVSHQCPECGWNR